MQSADHTVVMEAGRIAEEGTHDSLRVQGGIYAQLVRRQQGGSMPSEDPLQSSATAALSPPTPAAQRVRLTPNTMPDILARCCKQSC